MPVALLVLAVSVVIAVVLTYEGEAASNQQGSAAVPYGFRSSTVAVALVPALATALSADAKDDLLRRTAHQPPLAPTEQGLAPLPPDEILDLVPQEISAKALATYNKQNRDLVDRSLESLLTSRRVGVEGAFALGAVLASSARDIEYLEWLSGVLTDSIAAEGDSQAAKRSLAEVYLFVINAARDASPRTALQLWETTARRFPDRLDVVQIGASLMEELGNRDTAFSMLWAALARLGLAPVDLIHRPKEPGLESLAAQLAALLFTAGRANEAEPIVAWLRLIDSDYASIALANRY